MKQSKHLLDTEPATHEKNRLYYGDNLDIMQHHMKDESETVDLIYLDPPFNSQRNYNLIYKKLTGQPVPEQEEAFCDAWRLDSEKEELARQMPFILTGYGMPDDLVQFWKAWINALRNTQPHLLAYLVYMSVRLLEMRRLLKPTGSIYLHCDPTASHYIKVIMDGIFGHQSFRNEITWKRTGSHNDAKRKYGDVADIILFYTKSNQYTFNVQYAPYNQEYMDSFYKHIDENGRRYGSDNLVSPNPRPNLVYEYKGFPPHAYGWKVTREKMEQLDSEGRLLFPKSPDGRIRLKRFLDEMPGVPVSCVWDDIKPLQANAVERLGYPTQKPQALLERIIQASSNPGDVVFDPFAGCGTAVYAAHTLERRWIGCDVAILSVQLMRDALKKRYGLREGQHYEMSGIPGSVEGAQELFSRDPRQFQHWSVELSGGFASTKHSGDLGIDGRIYFDTNDGLKNLVLSVKGGKLNPAFVRELRGVLERDTDSKIGGFICLQKPTRGMLDEAAAAGMYEYLGTQYERLQIRTIDDLLAGRGFNTPSKVQRMDWVRQMHLGI
jgi:site-specific DNA-methyltransferase (adenine-specific)